MPMCIPEECSRGLSCCSPLASLEDEGGGFICMGKNDGSDVKEDRKQDIYTFCWKNDQIDERSHWDKRDLIDTMSVIAQGLSVIENNIV